MSKALDQDLRIRMTAPVYDRELWVPTQLLSVIDLAIVGNGEPLVAGQHWLRARRGQIHDREPSVR
jgi:hypothetical protein